MSREICQQCLARTSNTRANFLRNSTTPKVALKPLEFCLRRKAGDFRWSAVQPPLTYLLPRPQNKHCGDGLTEQLSLRSTTWVILKVEQSHCRHN